MFYFLTYSCDIWTQPTSNLGSALWQPKMPSGNLAGSIISTSFFAEALLVHLLNALLPSSDIVGCYRQYLFRVKGKGHDYRTEIIHCKHNKQGLQQDSWKFNILHSYSVVFPSFISIKCQLNILDNEENDPPKTFKPNQRQFVIYQVTSQLVNYVIHITQETKISLESHCMESLLKCNLFHSPKLVS